MIQLIRLLSGEEILCDFKDNIANNPIQLITTDANSLNFAPYIPYSKTESFYIKNESILWAVEPTEGLVDKYREMVTGITVPNKKIIT